MRRRTIRACGAAFAFLLVASQPSWAQTTALSLSYSITLRGTAIGAIEADIQFAGGAYTLALNGATNGFSRLMAAITATLTARGSIRGGTVSPAQYSSRTLNGQETAAADMALRNGNVTDLTVNPGLDPTQDLVPLTMDHVRGVTDPASALVVAIAHGGALSGDEACDRSLPIFDGWQRFDLDLTFVSTTTVSSGPSGYSGPVYVCHASYRPVAGFHQGSLAIAAMAGDDGMEAWLMPVPGQNILLPYKLIVGTQLGDIVIVLDRETISQTTP